VGLRRGMQPGALRRRQIEILYIRIISSAGPQPASTGFAHWANLAKACQGSSRLVFLVESGGCGVENAYQDPCAVELSSSLQNANCGPQRAPRTRPQGQMCISRHNQHTSPAQGRVFTHSYLQTPRKGKLDDTDWPRRMQPCSIHSLTS
jgi:hypothetical protein